MVIYHLNQLLDKDVKKLVKFARACARACASESVNVKYHKSINILEVDGWNDKLDLPKNLKRELRTEFSSLSFIVDKINTTPGYGIVNVKYKDLREKRNSYYENKL